MNEEKMKISKIEIRGELPSGCPWCPFDKLSESTEPCAIFGCKKSGYGFRPDGCKIEKVT